MSEQPFTAGPLIVVETRSYFAVKPVGTLAGKHQHGRTIAMCAKPHPRALADATLYAAAPAMYEALKHAHDILLAAAERMRRLGQDESARGLEAEAADVSAALSQASKKEGG